MSTRELVDALVAGDSIGIENSFNSVMSDKITSALDDYRKAVAQSMFSSEQETEEDDESSEADNDNTE